jgi:hypothetical protein
MAKHTTFLIFTLGLAAVLAAQQAAPKEERIGDGYLIQVLQPGAIPAIVAPEFVSREEGDKFMSDREPVLGVFDGQVAKAYSLWHLDRHEVVNDATPALGPIAVTW